MLSARIVAILVAVFVHGAVSLWSPLAVQAGPGVALEIHVNVGFGGRCRMGTWAPLRVVLRTGAERLDGSLRIVVPGDGRFSGAGSRTSYIYPLILPPNSTYEIRDVIPIEERMRPLEITVETNGTIFARQSVRLDRACTDDPLVAAVTGGARRLPPGLSSAGAPFVTCEAAPADLPEDPLGYDGVAAVALPLSSAVNLSDAQLGAIDSWTRQGGTLILTGGAGISLPLPSPLRDLVPMEITGDMAVRSFPSLLRRYGGEFTAPVPAVVLAGRLKQGLSALAEGIGSPLLAASRRGAGRIVFMAFDLSSAPFSDWEGLPRMWQEVLLTTLEDRPPSFKDIALSVLTRTRVFYPSVRPLVAFCAVYLLTVLAILMGPGRRARFAYAFAIVTCAVAAIFSGIAWRAVTPLARRATTVVSSVTIIESSNESGVARARAYLGVLPFSDGAARIGFEGPAWHVAGSGSTRGPGAGRDLEVSPGPSGGVLRSLDLRAWEMRVLRGEAVIPFSLHATIERMQGDTTLAVRNDTGVRLEEASVLAGEKVSYIGTVPDGQVITCSLGIDGTGGPVRLWTESQARLKQALFDELVVPCCLRRSLPDGTPAHARTPVLIAWAPRWKSGPTVSHPDAHRVEMALVILYLPELGRNEVGLP